MIVTTPNNDSIDALIRPDVFWYYSRRLKVPAIRAVSLLVWDPWLCCDPPRHLFSFNRTNLGRAGERAGFQILQTRTSFFDQDALGQPKYSFRGFGKPRSALESTMFLGSKFSAALGRALDPHRRKGSTLAVYLSVASSGS
jgi:hypothetical protein